MELSEREFERMRPIEQYLYRQGLEIEQLSAYYPCLREVCHGLPTAAYPAAMFVGAAFIGTLMTRCTYRFYHQVERLRRLNYAVFIIGDPGTGKSFAGHLYKILAAPIIRETMKGTKAVNRYKRQLKRWLDNGQKGDGPEEPHPLIRTHPARTSNKVFIKDMIHAVEIVDGQEMHLHLLSYDAELDNATNMQGDAWNNKFSMEIKAFHNERDGQAYASMDSELAEFDVMWNYVYTGTPLALRHKVNVNNIGTGYATRLAAIPMPSSHFKMMPFQELEEGQQEPQEDMTLRQWAEKLDKVHGELPIERLVDCTYQWASWQMDDAREEQSETSELLLKRVPYYGIAVSVPFIVMRHWDEWQQHGTLSIDETDERLCQLVMDIQLTCQHHFFGHYWDVYFEQARSALTFPQKRHTEQMRWRYNRLPEEFTSMTIQMMCDIKPRNAEKMIARWLKDNYIERTSYGHYRKLYLELT